MAKEPQKSPPCLLTTGTTMDHIRSRRRRLLPFKGSASQYAAHLEAQLLLLRKEITELRQQLVHAQSLTDQTSEAPSASHGAPDLVFHIETPKIQSDERLRTPDTKPKWKDKTALFLARVPTCERGWSNTRRDAQLSTPEQTIDAFKLLTLRSHSAGFSVPRPGSATSFATLQAYHGLQAVLRQHAIKSTQLYNYSLLLFFCICCVAREDGVSVEEVDKIVETCLPDRKQSSVYSMKLRRAAKWTAGVIERLESSKGYLASQLFMLCGPPMETYRTWSDQAEAKGYLVEQVEQKTKSAEMDAPEDVPVSFSPTFMIAYLGPWSLDLVNKALKTNLSQEKYKRRASVFQEIEALVESRVSLQQGDPMHAQESQPDSPSAPPSQPGTTEGGIPGMDHGVPVLGPMPASMNLASKWGDPGPMLDGPGHQKEPTDNLEEHTRESCTGEEHVSFTLGSDGDEAIWETYTRNTDFDAFDSMDLDTTGS